MNLPSIVADKLTCKTQQTVNCQSQHMHLHYWYTEHFSNTATTICQSAMWQSSQCFGSVVSWKTDKWL